MKKFAVFGNPIAHSFSPEIHQLFSEQSGIELTYTAEFSELAGFETDLMHFFEQQKGVGANITAPFKERAYHLCQDVTKRAEYAGVVNTISYSEQKGLLGDNTDGIGLIRDLQRLNMIQKGENILLLGAGGAAKGVLFPLLEQKCRVNVVNRTVDKAKELADDFKAYGDINALTQEQLFQLKESHFQLIINATSAGFQNTTFPLPQALINMETSYYDMAYGKSITPFLSWVKEKGGTDCADGLGMLVGQAAEAYSVWHGVMPDIEPVLHQLKKKYQSS